MKNCTAAGAGREEQAPMPDLGLLGALSCVGSSSGPEERFTPSCTCWDSSF